MNAIRNFWIGLALFVAVMVPVYFLVAALGTRFGLFNWQIGFGLMTFQWAPLVLMGSGALAVVGLLLALAVPPHGQGWKSALVALAIPAIGLGYGAYVRSTVTKVPPIHDISTDLADPPAFSQAVIEARAQIPGSNPVDNLAEERVPPIPAFGPASGQLSVDLQRQAFADIQPIQVSAAPAAAFDAALAAARAQGWTIGKEDRDAGAIEASVRSFWYGFTDDIVIRVRAHEAGSVVDVRSASRVGISDMGQNAKRIRAFAAAMQT